jgi:hypothetical protein
VGVHTAQLLIEEAGCIKAVWQQGPEALRQISGVGDKLVQALTQASLVSTQVDTLVTYCEQANILFVQMMTVGRKVYVNAVMHL